jgi:hypothetical protein
VKIGWFSTDFSFEPVPGQPGARTTTWGGTYHYRMAVPAAALEQHTSIECVLAPAIETAPDGHMRVMGVDRQWHDDCDIVVVQRWMHADGADRARKAIAAGQVVVNDVDDQFWALPTTNIARKTTEARDDFNRFHYRKMIAASSAVICSTPAIAGALSRLGPPVHVCRNAIDIGRWRQHDPGADGMVGWVGGVAWRGNDLPLLRGVLGPFLERHGLPFYHGGNSDDRNVPRAWDQLGLDTTRTTVAVNPIVGIREYPTLWDPINLAIIPLEDSTFNRGKSWLKGLEAAACGIPFVASRLPEYQLLGCGRLAKTPGQWRQHLDDLTDPDVRRVEGAANRARAEELSIDRQWSQWADLFASLTPAPEAVAA